MGITSRCLKIIIIYTYINEKLKQELKIIDRILLCVIQIYWARYCNMYVIIQYATAMLHFMHLSWWRSFWKYAQVFSLDHIEEWKLLLLLLPSERLLELFFPIRQNFLLWWLGFLDIPCIGWDSEAEYDDDVVLVKNWWLASILSLALLLLQSAITNDWTLLQLPLFEEPKAATQFFSVPTWYVLWTISGLGSLFCKRCCSLLGRSEGNGADISLWLCLSMSTVILFVVEPDVSFWSVQDIGCCFLRRLLKLPTLWWSYALNIRWGCTCCWCCWACIWCRGGTPNIGMAVKDGGAAGAYMAWGWTRMECSESELVWWRDDCKEQKNYAMMNIDKYLIGIVGFCAHGTNVYFVGHFYMCVVEFVSEYSCIFIM